MRRAVHIVTGSDGKPAKLACLAEETDRPGTVLIQWPDSEHRHPVRADSVRFLEPAPADFHPSSVVVRTERGGGVESFLINPSKEEK